MNLVESIERSLDRLTAMRIPEMRLEMQTQRLGQMPLEMEVVFFAIHMPIASGALLRIPVLAMLMPKGSSPIRGERRERAVRRSRARSQDDD
jgi:hypothetical protein